MKKPIYLFVIAVLCIATTMQARIILPSIISDNMVLQQNQTITIWGWTTQVREKLKVSASWSSDTMTVSAMNGRWSVELKTPSYGGPYALSISSHEIKTINNIMIGEVWLASGQSNMEMPVDSVNNGFQGVINYRDEIKNAENSNIRMYTVEKMISDYPQDNCSGSWQVSNPNNVKSFSATAYFFAKTLNQVLGIPIGIIASSWGGTNAESWVRKETITEDNHLYEPYLKLLNPQKTWPPAPGALYNAMIYPLENYKIKGVIWYQGESNVKNAEVYEEVMTTLIAQWRSAWGSEMPFYYTQIAPYTYKNNASAYLREAQLKTLKVAHTGMAVINDIGSLTTIHPLQKQQVGQRLAIWALANDYGKEILFSGPIYRSLTIQKDKIIIEFDYAQQGLIVKGKTLTDFEIAGEDRIFVPAQARIKGESVIVTNKAIKNPIAVRFAFSDTAQPNLFNKANLPTSAFRTDEW